MITLLTGYDKEFVQYLTERVFAYYGIDTIYMTQKSRKTDVSNARRMCWYILHHYYDYSSGIIGKIYDVTQRNARKGISSMRVLVKSIKKYETECDEILKTIEW